MKAAFNNPERAIDYLLNVLFAVFLGNSAKQHCLAAAVVAATAATAATVVAIVAATRVRGITTFCSKCPIDSQLPWSSVV